MLVSYIFVIVSYGHGILFYVYFTVNQEELFEPLTPEASPADQLEMLSDGDVHESGYPDYYEEIVSDEEEMFENEERLMDVKSIFIIFMFLYD